MFLVLGRVPGCSPDSRTGQTLPPDTCSPKPRSTQSTQQAKKRWPPNTLCCYVPGTGWVVEQLSRAEPHWHRAAVSLGRGGHQKKQPHTAHTFPAGWALAYGTEKALTLETPRSIMPHGLWG